MPLSACGVTHLGRRSTNEDSWLVDPDLGLLVVADGMGGHNAGEVASALAVESIREFLAASSAGPSGDILEQAVLYANERILSAALQKTEHAGMGTTVVAVLVVEGRAFYTSVGDSRLYLWHDGHLKRLTRDDSWVVSVSEEADRTEDIATHPMRHVLTKVVGLHSDLEPSSAECGLSTGDCLLLCSDGIHGTVPHAMLAQILGGDRGVRQTAEEVVRTAVEAGATDNATAIVACLGRDHTAEDTPTKSGSRPTAEGR